MAEPQTRTQDTPSAGQDQELAGAIEKWSSESFDLSQLPDLIKDVKSDERYSQYRGTIGIKKVLAQEPPPVQEIIDAGIVPRFFDFLGNSKEIGLQVITAGIFPNLVSGTKQQTKAIIDLGGLSAMIKLLQSPNQDLYKEAVFAVGNIASDSTKYRDMLINQGALEHVAKILATTEDHSLIKDATWALSNLCRGKPLPNPSKVSAAIPVLCGVIKMDTYLEATRDALLALVGVSEEPAQIQAVIATGVIPSLIKHLKGGDIEILIQCLRIMGNIITGDDEQTDFAVSFPDFLPELFQLAQHEKKIIRREACWIVSNITGGNTDQISLVINNLQYVQVLIKIALSDEIDVKKEAAWALSNATMHNNPSQIPQIIKIQVFDCLIDMLANDDAQVLQVALTGLDNILSKWGIKETTQGGERSEFIERLEEKGGLDKIEGLQCHQNNEVYEAALKILQNHYELDEQNNVIEK